MVSVFNEENHIFDGFMDTATKLFASEIPMYYTRGNHETRGAFATEFQRYFSPKKRISTIHSGKVRSVLSFWIRERTSRIPILNMPV